MNAARVPDPFHPELIRFRLMECGLYMAVWEMLKISVVDKVRSFYSFEFRDGEFVPSDEYRDRVLSKARHRLDASLEWLAEVDAIGKDDIATVHAIRHHRNEIAHELPVFAISWESAVDIALLVQARDLVHKLDNFWARVELEGDPDGKTPFSVPVVMGVQLRD
jgi:hypothetical protein